MNVALLMVDIVLKTTLLVTLVIIADRLMGSASAALRHRLWGIAFVAMLALPILSVTSPQWRLAVLPDLFGQLSSPDADSQATDRFSLDEPTIRKPSSEPLATELLLLPDHSLSLETTSDLQPSENLQPGVRGEELALPPLISDVHSPTKDWKFDFNSIPIGSWITIAWSIGFLIALVPLGLGVYFRRVIRSASIEIDDQEPVRLMAHLCQKLGIRRQVKLLECDRALIPMTWGIRKPTIVFPRSWRSWMTECQRLVLLHELAHVKRLDVLYQLIARVACAIYWFHPLVWYGLRRMRIERELACDDCVLMLGEKPISYAEQLLKLACDYSAVPYPPAVAMAQRSGLEARVRALLDEARSHLPIHPRMGAILLTGGGAFALFLAAIRLEATSNLNEQSVASESVSTPQETKGLTIRGQVHDVNGRAIPNAKVIALRDFQQRMRSSQDIDHHYEVLAETKSNDGGDYEMVVAPESSRFSNGVQFEERTTHVLAMKDGMEPQEIAVNSKSPSADVTLYVATEKIQGRIVDLEGQPVAGVRVRLTSIAKPGEALDKWLERARKNPATIPSSAMLSKIKDEAERTRAMEIVHFPVLEVTKAIQVLESTYETSTDADGTFTLDGFSKDRLATVKIESPNIGTTFLKVLTTDTSAVNYPDDDPRYRSSKIFGRSFVYTAEPSQLIQGFVSDRQSGKPIAGVTVAVQHLADNWFSLYGLLQDKTDKDGHYEIRGCPKAPPDSRGIQLFVDPPADQPYFRSYSFDVPKTQGMAPIERNLQLTRGIWITGQVTNAETRQAVPCLVAYYPNDTNPLAENHERFQKGMRTTGQSELFPTDEQGRFRIAGMPGQGLIRVVAENEWEYEMEGPEWSNQRSTTDPWQRYFIATKGNAMVLIEPAESIEEYSTDIALKPLPSIVVEVDDNDGKPIQGFRVAGRPAQGYRNLLGMGRQLRGESPVNESGMKVILGSQEGRDRSLVFLHDDRKLGAVIRVDDLKPDANGAYRVKLQSCATIIGKIAFDETFPDSNRLHPFMFRFGWGELKDDPNSTMLKDGISVDLSSTKRIERSCLAKTTIRPDGTFESIVPPCDDLRFLFQSETIHRSVSEKLTMQPGERIDVGQLSLSDPAKPLSQARKPVVTTVSTNANEVNSIESTASVAKQEKLVYTGTVIDPDNKPVSVAKLYFVFYQQGQLPDSNLKPLAITDDAGSFRIEIDPNDFSQFGADHWISANIFASKNGWGVASAPSVMFETTGAAKKKIEALGGMSMGEVFGRWTQMFGESQAYRLARENQTLQLVRDSQPLEGKLVDIEGQPVAGATVQLKHISWNDSGTLDKWNKAVKLDKADYYSTRTTVQGHNGHQLASVIPAVVSDKDGKFTMRGIGDNRIVELLIHGPNIETVMFKARTCDGETVTIPQDYKFNKMNETRLKTPDEVYYPRLFTHVASPSTPIIGRVTDAETQAPIADCLVTGGRSLIFSSGGHSHIATKTDSQGNYRLEGMPKSDENKVYVVPPADSAYVPWGGGVKLAQQQEPLSKNVTLRKGIIISGRSVDGKTGEPIAGVVEFYSMAGNKSLDNYQGFRSSRGHQVRTDSDGRYSIAALPGDSILAFMALDHIKYKKHLEAKSIDSTASPEERIGMKQTVPTILMTSSKHWVKELVVPEAGALEADITLNAGHRLKGQIFDADGKPTEEAIFVGGLEQDSWMQIKGGTFDIIGYYDDKPRELYFYQRSTNTAAYVKLQGKVADEIQVRLKPAATLKGRVVDQKGEPVDDVFILGNKIPSDHFGAPEYRLTTDSDGRFEIHGLVPGRSYEIHGSKDSYDHKLVEIKFDASEVKDVGDIKIKVTP